MTDEAEDADDADDTDDDAGLLGLQLAADARPVPARRAARTEVAFILTSVDDVER